MKIQFKWVLVVLLSKLKFNIRETKIFFDQKADGILGLGIMCNFYYKFRIE